MQKSRFHSILAVAIAVMAFSIAAFAQPAPGAPVIVAPGGIASVLNMLPQWGADVVVACTLLTAAFLAAANVLSFVGSFWPPALKAAAALAKAVAFLHKVGGVVGDAIPGSTAHAAKMAAKRMVPPVAALLLVFGLGASSSGCALFQSVAKNPAVYVGDFVTVANEANTVAVAAFDAALPLLSPAEQLVAKDAEAKAEATFQDSMTIVSDALAAYLNGSSASPNWSALIANAISAFDAIVAIANEWGGHVPTFGTAHMAVNDSLGRVARSAAVVHRYHAP